MIHRTSSFFVFPKNINRLEFVMKAQGVFCEVQNEILIEL